MLRKIFVLLVFGFFVGMGSSAHYIVGEVLDALDGESANGKVVVLWKYENGELDNLTDIIGVDGNSNADNIYMIDCEMLNSPCVVGDVLSLRVLNSGDNYFSEVVNVTVTGAGFDVADSLQLKSPLRVFDVLISDGVSFPALEINLVPAGLKEVTCSAVIVDYDMDEIVNATAEFFSSDSSFGGLDDNNTHYSNDSCVLDSSYGELTETLAICSFYIEYYANYGDWNCTVMAYNNYSIYDSNFSMTYVNQLLAIGVEGSIDFGEIDGGSFSDEISVEVINYGNTNINLSLSGYGEEEDDEKAMVCTGGDIDIGFKKYNLSLSNSGDIGFEDFDSLYLNLTSFPVVREFNLLKRTNNELNDARKNTFWRIFVPVSVGGDCSGNIVFGAVESEEVLG